MGGDRHVKNAVACGCTPDHSSCRTCSRFEFKNTDSGGNPSEVGGCPRQFILKD